MEADAFYNDFLKLNIYEEDEESDTEMKEPIQINMLEFLSTPRTLEEIIDKCTGLEEHVQELDEMNAYVEEIRKTCYNTLHDTYRRAYEKLIIRKDNAEVNENYQHMQRNLKPIARRFLAKTNDLLNRFALPGREIRNIVIQEEKWGPNMHVNDKNQIEAEVFLRSHEYNRFLDNFLLHNGVENRPGVLYNNTIPRYQQIFDEELDENILEDFRTHYKEYFFEEPYDNTSHFDVNRFFQRYVRNRGIIGKIKKMWKRIRYSLRVNIYEEERANTLEDVESLLGPNNPKPPANSACVQYAYQQKIILQARREEIAAVYRQRVPKIIEHLKELVRSGYVEVGNTYQRSTTHAKFVFATRRIRHIIHANIDQVPRGSMVCMRSPGSQNGELRIRNQRIKGKFNHFWNEWKSNNKAFDNNSMKRSFHKIEVEDIHLRAFAPYFTRIRLSQQYEDIDTWDRLVQDEPVEPSPAKKVRK